MMMRKSSCECKELARSFASLLHFLFPAEREGGPCRASNGHREKDGKIQANLNQTLHKESTVE